MILVFRLKITDKLYLCVNSKMAKKPETEPSKELTTAYLQNFTATYLNKLAVFNNLDLSTLDTKAKVFEALSALPKIS